MMLWTSLNGRYTTYTMIVRGKENKVTGGKNFNEKGKINNKELSFEISTLTRQ
jgi:hypothetical protein